jgi:phage gpG-like protein
MQFGAAQGEFGARIGKDKNGRDFFTTIPWGDIPARPFLGVGPDDENAIIQDIEDWFESIFDE